jgi:hypothetical protein
MKLISKAMLFSTFALLSLAMFAGCQTPTGARQTPAQIAAQVCPPTTAAITALQGLQGLDATAINDLAKAAPVVDAVCAVGATITITNLQTLAQTGFPALVAIANASPLPAQQKNNVVLGLTATQIIFDAVLAADPAAATIALPTK